MQPHFYPANRVDTVPLLWIIWSWWIFEQLNLFTIRIVDPAWMKRWIKCWLLWIKYLYINCFFVFLWRCDTGGYFFVIVKKYCIYPFANSFMHSLGGQLGREDR
ncbi:hypothetical protein CF119_17100 [Aeromonas sobria]|nr:hypothetical protein CF119_17100 [Aeromonas sobria]